MSIDYQEDKFRDSMMTEEDDSNRVYCFNEDGVAPLLLICEHASAFIPEHFDNLGIDDEVLYSHVAFDIGALKLAQALSGMLDAPLVAAATSRLVYDCNRAPGAPDAAPAKSEIYEIPGNRNLSVEQVRERYEQYYLPFEQAVSGKLAAFVSPPMVLTIHSFTPVYHGSERSLDIGVIVNGESRLSEALVQHIGSATDYRCAINEPYGPEHGVTHTLDLHANRQGLANAMLEVNNRLLLSDYDCLGVARRLAPVVARSAKLCGYSVRVGEGDASIH